jgi:hypothetical protein
VEEVLMQVEQVVLVEMVVVEMVVVIIQVQE